MEYDDWESDLHEACAHLGDSHQVGGKTQYLANKDECLKCLKDLQAHLKDSSDLGQRARLKLGEWKVLPNHLVPLFVAYREDPELAPSVLKVLVRMTARIDNMGPSEQLRHLQQLQDYKEAFLKKDTFIILMGMLLESMDEDEDGQRPETRVVVFDMVLELLRNLVTVPDPALGDAGFSPMRRDMQMGFIRHFHDEGVLDFFLLFAEGLASEQDCDKKAWALADIIYNICTHSDPEALAYGSKGKDKNVLKDLLAREQADTRLRMPMSTRHSRFGTSLISKTAEGSTTFLTSVMDNNTITKGGRVWRREFHDPEARNDKKVNMFHDPFFVDLEEGSVRDHNQLNTHVKNALEASKVMGEDVMGGLRKFFEEFMQTSFSSLVATLRSTLGVKRDGVPDENPGGPFARMKLLNFVSWFLEFHRHHHIAAATAAKQKREDAPIIDIAAIQGGIDLDMIQFTAARLREYGKGSNMHASHLVVTLRALAQQVKTIDVVVDSKDDDTRDCGEILTQNMIKDNVLFQLSWILKNYKSSSHDPRILTYTVEVFHYMLRLMRTLSERKGQKIEFQVETMGRIVKRGVTTMEQEIARLADARVVDNLFHLLEKYKRLSAALNSMLVKLIYSIIRAQKENIVVFFELSYFFRIQRIGSDPLVRDKRHAKRYGEMVSLLQYILRQFFKCAETNSCVFVELLFRKVPESQKEALLGDHTAEFAAILDNYENEEYARVLDRMRDGQTVNELKTRQRRLADGTLPWSEAEDEILRTRFHIYAEHPLCGELLAAELPEETQRTGAKVRKRLVELGLISSGRQAGMPSARQQDPGEPPSKKAKLDDNIEEPDTLLETDLERLLDAALDAEGGAGAAKSSQGGNASASGTPHPGKSAEDSWFDANMTDDVAAGGVAGEASGMDVDLEAELAAQMDHELFDPQTQSQRPPAASQQPASQQGRAPEAPPPGSVAPSKEESLEAAMETLLKEAPVGGHDSAEAPDASKAGAGPASAAAAHAPQPSASPTQAGFDLEQALESQLDKDLAATNATPQPSASPTQGGFDLEQALESQLDKDLLATAATPQPSASPTQAGFDLERALASQLDKDLLATAATPRRVPTPASNISQATPEAGRLNLEQALESEMERDPFTPHPGGVASQTPLSASPPAFGFDLEKALASQMEREQVAPSAAVAEDDPEVALESMFDEDLELP